MTVSFMSNLSYGKLDYVFITENFAGFLTSPGQSSSKMTESTCSLTDFTLEQALIKLQEIEKENVALKGNRVNSFVENEKIVTPHCIKPRFIKIFSILKLSFTSCILTV